MENNDVLRMFRYALSIPDATMVNIFTMAECRIDKPQLLNLLKKEDEPGYVSCSTTLLERFFDGLILYNRGEQEEENTSQLEDNPLTAKTGISQQEKRGELKGSSGKGCNDKPESLSNNSILKKIRIALDLKQEDMMEIFRLGKVTMTKGEFTALFRKQGHKNYKECGDQYLRKFLQGLAARHRM